MAKFAYNNTVSATTGITPFFALYGQHLRWIIKQNPTTKAPTSAVLEEWANQLKNLNTYLKSEMVYAQAIQAEQADKDRLPAPAYQVGDEGLAPSPTYPDHTPLVQARLQKTRTI